MHCPLTAVNGCCLCWYAKRMKYIVANVSSARGKYFFCNLWWYVCFMIWEYVIRSWSCLYLITDCNHPSHIRMLYTSIRYTPGTLCLSFTVIHCALEQNRLAILLFGPLFVAELFATRTCYAAFFPQPLLRQPCKVFFFVVLSTVCYFAIVCWSCFFFYILVL